MPPHEDSSAEAGAGLPTPSPPSSPSPSAGVVGAGLLTTPPELRDASPETLWAPWRMSYVSTESPAEGCPLCAKPSAENDREQLVLYRGNACFIIMNLFPYNNGHLMVAPYRHTADFAGLTPAELVEMSQLARYAVRVLEAAYHPHGYNLGMNLGRVAGAGIADHLHLHVVPRWNGDTNFMPVTGYTRVLPQALLPSYDSLAEAIRRLGPPVPETP